MSNPAQKTLEEKDQTGIQPVLSLSNFPGWDIFEETSFLRMLALERKRIERSKRQFVLMLLDCEALLKGRTGERTRQKLLTALAHRTRIEDIKGWYKAGCVLGVIFTEFGMVEGEVVAATLLNRFTVALRDALGVDDARTVKFSFHIFPEDPSVLNQIGLAQPVVAPQLKTRKYRFLKRVIDIIGSIVALVVSLPLLILISAVIVCTSKGPILFRQQRVGKDGSRFTFLKFRSMYCSNDHTIHKEYVTRMIAGNREPVAAASSGPKVYKLTDDPRITPIGRILRRTSLDELPQFINVLKGEMSIVGPRPPIPYEFDAYNNWHKRRMLAVKPGITGLWQVQGRSRVTFDEMVRLDLQYARSWSPWLDLKIICRTPRAVFSGDGAY